MQFSRKIGRFALDRRIIGLLLLGAALLGARSWLAANPQHDPWAPLNLSDPPGWATQRKLAALRQEPAECRAVLDRSNVSYSALDPVGEGACRRADRTQLSASPLQPEPAGTCALMAGFHLWVERSVRPAALKNFRSSLAGIEHYGTYSCRRLYGRDHGPWSEHATGNAIDIAAFVLADGRRIAVQDDWTDTGEEGRFLHKVRDEACEIFGTVLSPDYNAAHRDHFHFDQFARAFGACR